MTPKSKKILRKSIIAGTVVSALACTYIMVMDLRGAVLALGYMFAFLALFGTAAYERM